MAASRLIYSRGAHYSKFSTGVYFEIECFGDARIADVATAIWIDVPHAAGVTAERAMRDHLRPVRRLSAAVGYELIISPEAVRWRSRRMARLIRSSLSRAVGDVRHD